MFDIESRKIHTRNIIMFFKNELYKINPNHIINGFIIFLIHWIACTIPCLIILIGNINIYFYISCMWWGLVVCAHFYFKGCILTRIERELWQDTTWVGPWVIPFTIIERFGINITPNLTENIFICWGIILTTFVFLKLLCKND